MKKGYIFVIAFALFIALTQTYKYRVFERKSLEPSTTNAIIAQIIMMFLLFLIPGLLIARWYYKNKNRS